MNCHPERSEGSAVSYFVRISLSLLLVIYALSTFGQAQEEVSSEAYDVYSAVLTQHYGSWFKEKVPVLIFSKTVLEPQGHSGGGCKPQAEKNPVVLNLLDKLLSEKQQLRIEGKLRLPRPYKMVTGKLQSSENDESGVFSLSGVEFSGDRSRAMVLVEQDCGALRLCGTGYVWMLHKSKS